MTKVITECAATSKGSPTLTAAIAVDKEAEEVEEEVEATAISSTSSCSSSWSTSSEWPDRRTAPLFYTTRHKLQGKEESADRTTRRGARGKEGAVDEVGRLTRARE